MDVLNGEELEAQIRNVLHVPRCTAHSRPPAHLCALGRDRQEDRGQFSRCSGSEQIVCMSIAWWRCAVFLLQVKQEKCYRHGAVFLLQVKQEKCHASVSANNGGLRSHEDKRRQLVALPPTRFHWRTLSYLLPFLTRSPDGRRQHLDWRNRGRNANNELTTYPARRQGMAPAQSPERTLMWLFRLLRKGLRLRFNSKIFASAWMRGGSGPKGEAQSLPQRETGGQNHAGSPTDGLRCTSLRVGCTPGHLHRMWRNIDVLNKRKLRATGHPQAASLSRN